MHPEKHIIIFDDGDIKQTETCGDDIIHGVESGVVEAVDVSRPTRPKKYVPDKGWVDVEWAE